MTAPERPTGLAYSAQPAKDGRLVIFGLTFFAVCVASSTMNVPILNPQNVDWFPSLNCAIEVDGCNGLLAIGGDLSPERLLAAYRNTIFPWYDQGCPIMWWSPDPRTVIFPERIHVSGSMARLIRQGRFDVTWNTAFEQVIQKCAAPRFENDSTWILPEMIEAYTTLHKMGYAESCEIWRDQKLVGGVYGVSIGRVFFGESMFHEETNASKLSLIQVARCERFSLIDCQLPTPHLFSLGAESIPRMQFKELVLTLTESA